MSRLSRREFGALAGAVLLLPPGSGRGAAQKTHAVEISRFAFHPATLTIAPGDRVRWTNSDLAPHTATDSAAAWDTGGLGRDESRVLTFDQRGSYAYVCAFHPQMTAKIHVADRPATAPGRAGPSDKENGA